MQTLDQINFTIGSTSESIPLALCMYMHRSALVRKCFSRVLRIEINLKNSTLTQRSFLFLFAQINFINARIHKAVKFFMRKQ